MGVVCWVGWNAMTTLQQRCSNLNQMFVRGWLDGGGTIADCLTYCDLQYAPTFSQNDILDQLESTGKASETISVLYPRKEWAERYIKVKEECVQGLMRILRCTTSEEEA